MSAETAERPPSLAGQREWWLRALLVFQAPRSAFVALRDESADSLEARQEPITAIVLLAGMAWVLSTPTAGGLLDDSRYDGGILAVWAFVVGSLFGVASYWVVGAALHLVGRQLGSLGSYRRARQVVGLAAAPLALSLLVLLPLRLALYGGDIFRRGGADSGTFGEVLEHAELAFVVWAAVLLVVGVRAVHGWTWARSAATVGVALAVVFVASRVLFPLLRGS